MKWTWPTSIFEVLIKLVPSSIYRPNMYAFLVPPSSKILSCDSCRNSCTRIGYFIGNKFCRYLISRIWRDSSDTNCLQTKSFWYWNFAYHRTWIVKRLVLSMHRTKESFITGWEWAQIKKKINSEQKKKEKKKTCLTDHSFHWWRTITRPWIRLPLYYEYRNLDLTMCQGQGNCSLYRGFVKSRITNFTWQFTWFSIWYIKFIGWKLCKDALILQNFLRGNVPRSL